MNLEPAKEHEGGDDVIRIGVRTLIRGKHAEEVQRGPPAGNVPNGLQERRVLEKGAVVDCPGDTNRILEHDATGAEIDVAGFGVSRLPRW
jgi:hypothetical protein